MIYQPSLLREVFHFYARKMNQKVYSVGVSKQVFNGPVGTTNGPDYGAVIDGAGLSVQLGTQEIRGASKLKLVGFDEKGKELESVELAQGTKLRLMINAESISFVNVSNAKVFIEDVRDVGAVAASSDSSIWISRANEIGGNLVRVWKHHGREVQNTDRCTVEAGSGHCQDEARCKPKASEHPSGRKRLKPGFCLFQLRSGREKFQFPVSC